MAKELEGLHPLLAGKGDTQSYRWHHPETLPAGFESEPQSVVEKALLARGPHRLSRSTPAGKVVPPSFRRQQTPPDGTFPAALSVRLAAESKAGSG